MVQPTVSVVIPAYRAEHTIARAVDSVLAQSVPVHEIIVVDDGSPDNQVEVIRRYGAKVVLVRQANSKTAIARNTGIERASGDFVAFLDADDFWEPQKLERQLAVFASNPQVGVVGGRFNYQLDDGSRVVNVTQKTEWYDRVCDVSGPQAFMLGTMIWTGTVIVRRELLAEDRFVSGLEPAEDRDLWVRLVAKAPVYLLSEPLATAVLTEGSISRSDLAHDCTQMLKVVARHRQTLGWMPTRLWRSYVRYRWACNETSPSIALPMLIRSIAGWPAPFLGMPTVKSFARLRRLSVLLASSFPAPRSLTHSRSL